MKLQNIYVKCFSCPYLSLTGGFCSHPCHSDHMENISGYLMKYTNLVTGWQYRYFVLNNEAGLLEYFVNEQLRNQKPRGTLQLAGAVISPSDEDSHTFTVNAASGEQYKLRATDAKERQHWVSRLQICTQHHTEAIGKNNPPLKSRSFSLASQGSGSPGVQRRPSQNASSFFNVGHHKLPAGKKIPVLQPDHLVDVREMMTQAEGQQRDLIKSIECLPASGHLSSLDQDLLMLKATSMATMNCLNDCFHILQLQHASQQKGSMSTSTTISWLEPKISLPNHFKNGADQDFAEEQNKLSVREDQSISSSSQLMRELEEINPDEEVEDTCDNKEDDLGAVEEQRSVILHLLSQLKLGMDLTRVVLPTFILEKRSLLEMYADFMSHPDLFIAISSGTTPEERMIRFVEYYLTSFHEGRKGAIAKKPYNPIIGETFHCSWKMAKSQVPCDTNSNSSLHSLSEHVTVSEESQGQAESDDYTVRFVAEQVSHHPPVSGFYAECAERKMCVNAHVWTKSKFLGMSIGVTMVGEGMWKMLQLTTSLTN
ncbi:hypothetical protein lerEdw1_003302 [Lerista edwardsae]|nr:hypothetical protein lerEdw1_003302 [Lerista edwardsae]